MKDRRQWQHKHVRINGEGFMLGAYDPASETYSARRHRDGAAFNFLADFLEDAMGIEWLPDKPPRPLPSFPIDERVSDE